MFFCVFYEVIQIKKRVGFLGAEWLPNKKTYILCITKKNNKADTQTDPVFTYLVSEIGESRDIYRFNIEQNDLNEATTLYNFFKGNKSNFEQFNTDPRCKIFSIDRFEPDIHWSIDRWWSREEKIALGIEEEDKAVDMLEFSSIVSDISETLGGFSAMIKETSEKKKSKINYKKVKIVDIFEILGEDNLTKTFINLNSGEYPVYSGQIENGGVFGYINSYKYDEEILTWVTYGNSGHIFKRSGKFNIGRNNCGLRPKFDKLNLEYVKYISEPIFIKNIKGEKQKSLPQTIVKQIEISIPINSNGDFDIKAQEEIVEKYNLINDLKSKVVEYKQTIKNLKVTIDDELEDFKEPKINEIFETKKGLSKYTKAYGQANKGEYPVYSASNIAPLTYINSYDYNGKYLTWATNGFAGYIKVIDEKFSANGDRGILIPKYNELDLDYVKFALEPILRKLAKGRKGDNGEDEFTKVYPSMVKSVAIKIPILKNGNFDIETQKSIAKKYLIIEQIKTSIEEELTKIEKLMVNI